MKYRLRELKTCFVLATGLGLVGLQSGCLIVAAGAVGAGAVAYVKGELESNLDAGLSEVMTAANGAVAELGLITINSNQDRLVGRITARTADDRRVEIRCDGVASYYTKVRIRVGVLGDEPLSIRVLDAIKARL